MKQAAGAMKSATTIYKKLDAARAEEAKKAVAAVVGKIKGP